MPSLAFGELSPSPIAAKYKFRHSLEQDSRLKNLEQIAAATRNNHIEPTCTTANAGPPNPTNFIILPEQASHMPRKSESHPDYSSSALFMTNQISSLLDMPSNNQ
jgi:hypothetical protein